MIWAILFATQLKKIPPTIGEWINLKAFTHVTETVGKGIRVMYGKETGGKTPLVVEIGGEVEKIRSKYDVEINASTGIGNLRKGFTLARGMGIKFKARYLGLEKKAELPMDVYGYVGIVWEDKDQTKKLELGMGGSYGMKFSLGEEVTEIKPQKNVWAYFSLHSEALKKPKYTYFDTYRNNLEIQIELNNPKINVEAKYAPLNNLQFPFLLNFGGEYGNKGIKVHAGIEIPIK